MAETCEMILHTALELCSRRGCEAVSVRDICSAVGIKESSLYYHFPGKQAVIDELYSRFEEHCAALTGELDAALEAGSPPGREGFMNVCAHFFDGYLSDPFCNGVLRLLDIERRSSPEALRLYTRWMFDEPLSYQARVFAALTGPGGADYLAVKFYAPIYLYANRYLLCGELDGEAKAAFREAASAHAARFFSEMEALYG